VLEQLHRLEQLGARRGPVARAGVDDTLLDVGEGDEIAGPGRPGTRPGAAQEVGGGRIPVELEGGQRSGDVDADEEPLRLTRPVEGGEEPSGLLEDVRGRAEVAEVVQSSTLGPQLLGLSEPVDRVLPLTARSSG
jgi:hypothetical protein